MTARVPLGASCPQCASFHWWCLRSPRHWSTNTSVLDIAVSLHHTADQCDRGKARSRSSRGSSFETAAEFSLCDSSFKMDRAHRFVSHHAKDLCNVNFRFGTYAQVGAWCLKLCRSCARSLTLRKNCPRSCSQQRNASVPSDFICATKIAVEALQQFTRSFLSLLI